MTRAFALTLFAACSGSHSTPTTTTAASPPPSNHVEASPPPVAPVAGNAVLGWPIPKFSKEQAAEVGKCDVEALGKTRYPKTVAVDALRAAFATKTACDEATLAAACASRITDEDATLPATCLDAYRAAVKANPAFVVAAALVGDYFGKVTIVGAPPVASHALASVELVYSWGGMGNPVDWKLVAKDLAGKPTIAVTGSNAKPGLKWSADNAPLFAALRTSLVNFIPVPQPITAVNCTDTNPAWTATLTFDDGTSLVLDTHGSNLLGLGGPWQTTIGGVNYMQLGPDFIQALVNVIKKLDLAIGQPMGSTCHAYNIQAEVLGV